MKSGAEGEGEVSVLQGFFDAEYMGGHVEYPSRVQIPVSSSRMALGNKSKVLLMLDSFFTSTAFPFASSFSVNAISESLSLRLTKALRFFSLNLIQL